MANPFSEGDLVIEKGDDLQFEWEVLEVDGLHCLIGDMGERTSHIVRRWVWADELMFAPVDEEYGSDDEYIIGY